MSRITKLGMGIVAFEGTEHIKNIAYELRDSVDEIVVCLQERSYTGVMIDKYDIEEVNRCLDARLIDKIIWYKAPEDEMIRAESNLEEFADVPRRLECCKRNMILDVLEDDYCSHAIIIDSDEYYDRNDFERAKSYIDSSNDVCVTYCQYINYWQDYRHYLIWTKPVYVPFISEITYRFEYGTNLDIAVDSTRAYHMDEGCYYNVLKWECVHMHHMSWVRLDIRKKIASWSSKKYYSQSALDTILEKYESWKETDNAYVMFRVPLEPVCVRTYDVPYINPHYVLYETNLTDYDG